MKKLTVVMSAACLGASLVANAELVHSWSFNETNGSTVADSVGNNDGAVGTAGSPNLDVAGPNVTFNGGSAFDVNAAVASGITAGVDANFSGNPAFAVSLWFNADALTDTDRLFQIGSTTGTREQLAITAEGKGLGLRYQGGNLFYGSLSADTWTHVIVQYDGTSISTDSVDVYLNGVLQAENGQGNKANSGALNIQTAGLFIGKSHSNLEAEAYNGTFDEVKLFNATLTQAEVTSLYNNNSVIPEPATLGILIVVGGAAFIRRHYKYDVARQARGQ